MSGLMEHMVRLTEECIRLEMNPERVELLKSLKSIIETVKMTANVDQEFSKRILRVEDAIVEYHLHLFNINQNPTSKLVRCLVCRSSNADTVSENSQIQNKQMSIESLDHKEHSPLLMKSSSPPEYMSRSSLANEFVRSIVNLYEYLVFSKESKLAVRELDNVIRQQINITSRSTSTEANKPVNRSYNGAQSDLVIAATSMVGRQNEVIKVKKYLLTDEKREVVSLIGLEGIGKTTIARQVYKQVKPQFDCYAWAFVSQKSQPRILRDIFTSFLESLSVMVPKDLEALGIEQLKEKIRSLLNGRKFLLVLDDLSNLDDFEFIKGALPRGHKGKILLTSRHSKKKISKISKIIENLGKLSSDDALQLLCKRAFLEPVNSDFWLSVQSTAEKIVEKCGCNPLAISMIGGMLSTKQEVSEWEKLVHQRLESTTDYIRYCYDDLPPEVKSCFLYSSLLPPQYDISGKKLIRLWIGEGFIDDRTKLDESKTKEHIAKDRLSELIQRHMFQAGQVGVDGDIKTYQILRPIQDFALLQSSIDSFPTELHLEESSFTDRGFRLSLHDNDNSSSSIVKVRHLNLNKLYSFLGFTRRKDHARLVTSNCTFKLLFVLELQHLPLENLPSLVGDLVFLQYLGLRGTKLKKLPATALAKLVRLQTLDIRDTPIRDVHIGRDGLKMLRNLLLGGSFNDKVINLSPEIKHLKDLHTLAGVKLTKCIANGLTHLSQLKKLSVGMIESNLSICLLQSIERMKFLQSLTLKCATGEKIDLGIRNLPESLIKLRVGGHVENLFLAGFNRLKNLRYLYVWDCPMTEDPLSSLQHLPNLVQVSLCNAYAGEKISFGKKSFPKLKKLSIVRLQNLTRCEDIMAGSLEKLEVFTIGYCPKLSTAPNGLENLTSLQMLQLTSMPENFVAKVRDFLYKQQKLMFSLLVLGIPELPRATFSFSPSLQFHEFNKADDHRSLDIKRKLE